MTNIVNQKYWDSSYSKYNYYLADKNDPIRTYIEKSFGEKKGNSVFEVGCFPGRYLGVFGELGYELNGIDITPRIKDDFETYLTSKGFKVGNFIHGSFPDKHITTYDIVSSVGFVEHFTNFLEIIHEHTKLVNNGGHIIIFTPNFAYGFQKWFHTHFDKVNTERHVLESMNPELWSKTLEKEGFVVIDKGFLGGFDIWWDNEERHFLVKYTLLSILILKLSLNKILGFFGKSLFDYPNNRNYSPYCFILAKKVGK